MKHIILLFFALTFTFPAVAANKIVASYPPIQSLVWSITEGIAPVNVMFSKPTGGHHDVQLEPSQMRILQKADIVFWASEEMETFMPDALKAVAPKAVSVPLLESTPDLHILPSTVHHNKKDVHFWLDVDNAILTLDTITDVMVKQDPKNAEKYRANNQKAKDYFEKLKEVEKPAAGKKFLALHDGFDYMADYFGLDIETINVDTENLNSPQALQLFSQQLKQSNADCILIAPETTRRQIKDWGLKDEPVVKMDGFGWNIKANAGAYYKMMQWNMNALRKCSR